MSWANILKRPVVDVPEPDKYFEYNPKLLEQIVKDWDKDNPAKVIHIEAPSTPDPEMRLDDGTIRFAPSGSRKFIKDAFRFITDRPIDDITGLKAKLREEGYTISTRSNKWVRQNYGEKVGRIVIPDEAVAHIIGVTPKISGPIRDDPKNRGKTFRMPDRTRKVEDIERWNQQKKQNNLHTVEGFTKFVNAQVKANYSNVIAERTKRMLEGAFGRNKHDLYLAQQLMLNVRWINQNIVKPVVNMMNKEKIARQAEEKERREREAADYAANRERSIAGARAKENPITSDAQIERLERRLSAAQRAGNTKQVSQLQNAINDIKERNEEARRKREEVNKMSWKEVLKSHCGTTEKLEDDDPFEKKEEVKPDYIDLDKDGNTKEPMKEAAKDAKKKKKGTNNAFMAKD